MSREQQKSTIKPIFIELNINEVREVLKILKLKDILYKMQSGKTQIFAPTIEAKSSIMNMLKSKKIGFYSFTEKSEKPLTFVLKGFYKTSCEEVLNKLKEAKIPVIRVTKLESKIQETEKNFIFYIVQISSDATNINSNVLNHNHQVIDNIIVKWENFKRSNKSPTQCFNCQRWGHSSQNCGFPFKCVKCTEHHAPGQCMRKTREGTPKCINCGGDHAASFRKCPKFIEYFNKFKISSKPQVIKTAKHNPVVLFDMNNFPQLPLSENQSQNTVVPPSTSSQDSTIKPNYAEKLNDAIANENLFNRFVNIQEKIKQKPKIVDLFNKFCSLLEEAEKKSTLGEVAQLFINFRTSFNSNESTS
jgi:hypothetical protein